VVNKILTAMGVFMDGGLVAAYAALGFSILAAGTIISGAVVYFVNVLSEPRS
jgi:hypothetical protein